MNTANDYSLHEMVDFAAAVVETTAFKRVLISVIETFNLPHFLFGMGIQAEAGAMCRLEDKVAARLLDQFADQVA